MAHTQVKPFDPREQTVSDHPVLKMPGLARTLHDIGATVDIVRDSAIQRMHDRELDRQQHVLDSYEHELADAERIIARLLPSIGYPRLLAMLERQAQEMEL